MEEIKITGRRSGGNSNKTAGKITRKSPHREEWTVGTAQWARVLALPSARTWVQTYGTHERSQSWLHESVTSALWGRGRNKMIWDLPGQLMSPAEMASFLYSERLCVKEIRWRAQKKGPQVLLWPLHLQACTNTPIHSHVCTVQSRKRKSKWSGT